MCFVAGNVWGAAVCGCVWSVMQAGMFDLMWVDEFVVCAPEISAWKSDRFVIA